MSEEQADNGATEAPVESKSVEAPKQAIPAVSMEQLKEMVKKEAEELVSKRDATNKQDIASVEKSIREKIARDLTGEGKANPVDPVLKQLLTDPTGTLTEVAKHAVEQSKKEQAEAAKQAQTDEKALAPFAKDYPELTGEHFEYLDVLVGKHLSEGKSREEAIKAGAQDAVKKLKLKSVSERIKEGTYTDTTVPGIGGMSFDSGSFNAAKSGTDYISGLKATHNKFKGRAKR